MNYGFYIQLAFLAVLFSSCNEKKKEEINLKEEYTARLLEIQEDFVYSEIHDDPTKRLSYYTENTILMPEYQPILRGKKAVNLFYSKIYDRQKIVSHKRKISEIIDLGNTIIEIGTFNKEFIHSADRKKERHQGEYWNIWEVQSNQELLLKAEGYGFFHHVDHPALLTLDSLATKRYRTPGVEPDIVPIELQAYNALNANAVRNRDGILRSKLYDDQGSFKPFADTTKTGTVELKEHLIAYNKGDVIIEHIKVYTYDFEMLEEYVIEYSKFEVGWQIPEFSGYTEGKGIRLWKRQEDCSLKIFRNIGMHNFIE